MTPPLSLTLFIKSDDPASFPTLPDDRPAAAEQPEQDRQELGPEILRGFILTGIGPPSAALRGCTGVAGKR